MGEPGAGVVRDDGTIGMTPDGKFALFDADGLSCCCDGFPRRCGDVNKPTEWSGSGTVTNFSGNIEGSERVRGFAIETANIGILTTTTGAVVHTNNDDNDNREIQSTFQINNLSFTGYDFRLSSGAFLIKEIDGAKSVIRTDTWQTLKFDVSWVISFELREPSPGIFTIDRLHEITWEWVGKVNSGTPSLPILSNAYENGFESFKMADYDSVVENTCYDLIETSYAANLLGQFGESINQTSDWALSLP